MCERRECQARKEWPLTAPGTPTRPAPATPRPQPRSLSVCQQLGLRCSVPAALWAQGRQRRRPLLLLGARGGGPTPRRLFISNEEFCWQLGQVAAGKTQVRSLVMVWCAHTHVHACTPPRLCGHTHVHLHMHTRTCAHTIHDQARAHTHTRVDTRSPCSSFIKQQNINIKEDSIYRRSKPSRNQ